MGENKHFSYSEDIKEQKQPIHWKYYDHYTVWFLATCKGKYGLNPPR